MTMPADHPPFLIVDTARLLVVDPCRLAPQLVRVWSVLGWRCSS